MGCTITHAQWKACIADDTHWQGLFYDEALFDINGQLLNDVPLDIDPKTAIKVKQGIVMVDDTTKEVRSLAAHINRWKRQQSYEDVVIRVPSGVTDKEIRDALKSIGASIV